MNRLLTPGLAMLAGVAIGAFAVQGLHAQAKPPTYVVIDISAMTDPRGFKAIPSSPAAGQPGPRNLAAATSSGPKR